MTAPALNYQFAALAGVTGNYISPGVSEKDGVAWYRQPFVYDVEFLNIVNATTVVNTANVQNDSFFVCVAQMASIFDHATGLVNTDPAVAPMLVYLVDTSSGKYLSDKPVAIGNWFGTGERPFFWTARAQTYRPGGQIQAQLTNNMAAAQDVRLSFLGFKIYNGIPDDSATG